MPTTIPYDPSLVLGNILDPGRVETLKKIADEQKKIDADQDKLNALILYKYSLDMTMQEMINMEVHDQAGASSASGNGASGNGSSGNVKQQADLLKPLKDEIDQLKKDIVAAAVEYSQTAINGQKAIAKLKSEAP